MKIRTSEEQEFETPDEYTYFGTPSGSLGFHVSLVDGKVTVYFADAKLKLRDKDSVRIII